MNPTITGTPLRPGATSRDNNKGNRVYDPSGKVTTSSAPFSCLTWDCTESLNDNNVRAKPSLHTRLWWALGLAQDVKSRASSPGF